MNEEQIEKLFLLIESNNKNAAAAKALEKLKKHIQELRNTVDELSVGLEDEWLSTMVSNVMNGESE
jgi:hypothetical protein